MLSGAVWAGFQGFGEHQMLIFRTIVAFVGALLRDRSELAAENIALRHQLALFLNPDVESVSSPESTWNPEASDFEMREKIFKLAMLEEGFYIFHGYGSISAAHTDEEIQRSLDSAEKIAKKWQ